MNPITAMISAAHKAINEAMDRGEITIEDAEEFAAEAADLDNTTKYIVYKLGDRIMTDPTEDEVEAVRQRLLADRTNTRGGA